VLDYFKMYPERAVPDIKTMALAKVDREVTFDIATARRLDELARNTGKGGVEVSCTGGITDENQWIRLFPIPYRFLDADQRFRKYQWIEVEAAKSSDDRPESYEINLDSLKITSPVLPTDDSWKARKDLIFPLQAPSLCYLYRNRKLTRTSLGLFKPERINKLVIRNDAPDWTTQERQILTQFDLFGKAPKKTLEKIPFKFVYTFTCSDDVAWVTTYRAVIGRWAKPFANGGARIRISGKRSSERHSRME
jgi:hypothetical protein